jgi:hypothetical protein
VGVNPYCNKWWKVFDFNKADGEEHWSVAQPYSTPEKMKALLDFSKCENAEFAQEVLGSLDGSNLRRADQRIIAIYLVLEAPFSLGRGWLHLPLKDTLRRTIPLVNGSAQPLQHA